MMNWIPTSQSAVMSFENGNIIQSSNSYYNRVCASTSMRNRVSPNATASPPMRNPMMPKLKTIEQVKEAMRQFAVTQVYGAPLVGKSVLVCQALDDMQGIHLVNDRKVFHVLCKGLCSLQAILNRLVTNLRLDCHDLHQLNAAKCIYDLLHVRNEARVTFVFHKCEALMEIERFDFLKFLCDLNAVSNNCIRCVLTTYKKFVMLSHPSFGEIQVDMMDNLDIRSFLQFYLQSHKSGIDIEGYVQMIFRNNLCFPVAVRHFVEVYLLQKEHGSMPDADVVDMQLKEFSFQFLSKMLHQRVLEVETWISASRRKWIALFCQSPDGTFTEELLQEMTKSENDNRVNSREWNDLLRTFALRQVPGLNRVHFHPLVVYYFMLEMYDRRLALEGMWFDISCSKVVKFLCGVLGLTEEMSQCAGHKSAIFQCVLPEWPNMKNTIQMAIHCNHNTYKDFCKVAVVGAHLMVKWFPIESVQFFQSLYDHASQKRYLREAAILQGLLAHAIHMGSGNTQRGKSISSACCS